MPAQSDAPPGATGQMRILTLMRQYVATYQWPDIAFDQKIIHFEGSPGSNKWHKVHTDCSARILLHDGTESWRRSKDNCRPIANEKWRKAGFFKGVRLPHVDLFKPLANGRASIAWDRWGTIGERRFAVFRYTVSLSNSEWVYSEDLRGGGSAKVPYSGSIFVDPATGAIWRISDAVTAIPAGFLGGPVFGIVDYEDVTIGAAHYMLAVTRTTVSNFGGVSFRDEFVWFNHHRFEADSSIRYAP